MVCVGCGANNDSGPQAWPVENVCQHCLVITRKVIKQREKLRLARKRRR